MGVRQGSSPVADGPCTREAQEQRLSRCLTCGACALHMAAGERLSSTSMRVEVHITGWACAYGCLVRLLARWLMALARVKPGAAAEPMPTVQCACAVTAGERLSSASMRVEVHITA